MNMKADELVGKTIANVVYPTDGAMVIRFTDGTIIFLDNGLGVSPNVTTTEGDVEFNA